MPGKLSISQIFLPNHKLALNFVSAYQESVRSGTFIDLFLLIEIKGEKKSKSGKKQEEYEKIAQTLVRTLKNSYLSEREITEASFEKALSAINHELSSLGRSGVVSWYKKLNALIAVCANNVLYLSSAGQMSGLLLRKREFSQITETLSPPQTQNPIKTFGSFASGALLEGDCILLTTPGLYNYLSLERLRSTLSKKEELENAGKQLVDTLKADMGPTDAFAAFVCTYHTRPKIKDSELQPLISPAAHTLIEDNEAFAASEKSSLRLVKQGAETIIRALAAGSKVGYAGILRLLNALFSRLGKTRASVPGQNASKPSAPASSSKRRTYLVAFLLAAVLLAINLIFFNFRNASEKLRAELQTKLTAAEEALTAAEAAMIYNDENRARTEVAKAENSLLEVKKDSRFEKETAKLQDKLDQLSNRLNKITRLDNLEILGNFTQTPDELIVLTDGFLGFNSFTDTFEKLQIPGGQTQSFAQEGPTAEDLVDGVFFQPLSTLVFLTDSGRFYKLDPQTGAFSPLFSTSTAATTGFDMQALAVYESRLYGVDAANSQIQRFSPAFQSIGSPTPWLKESHDLSNAKDLAVDGSIYVLQAGAVNKFTLGQAQTFTLPELAGGLSEATKIRTAKDLAYIYLADPQNSRIVAINKSGGLQAQYVSPKFSELKDIYVDESRRVIYYLAGNELGRFGY